MCELAKWILLAGALLATRAFGSIPDWFVLGHSAMASGAGFSYTLYTQNQNLLDPKMSFMAPEMLDRAIAIPSGAADFRVLAIGRQSHNLFLCSSGVARVIASSTTAVGWVSQGVIPVVSAAGYLTYFDLATLAFDPMNGAMIGAPADVVRILDRGKGENLILRRDFLERVSGSIPLHSAEPLVGTHVTQYPGFRTSYTIQQVHEMWANDKFVWVMTTGTMGTYRGVLLILYAITSNGFMELAVKDVPNSQPEDIQMVAMDANSGECFFRIGNDLVEMVQHPQSGFHRLVNSFGTFSVATLAYFHAQTHLEVLPSYQAFNANLSLKPQPGVASVPTPTSVGFGEQQMLAVMRGAWTKWQAKGAKAPFPEQEIDAKTLAAFINGSPSPDLLPIFKGMTYEGLKALGLELRTGQLYCPSRSLTGQLIPLDALARAMAGIVNQLGCADQITLQSI